MIQHLKKSKDRVAYLLAQYPELKDNDVMLTLAYYETYHNLEGIIGQGMLGLLKMFLGDPAVPCFESIRRNRQRLNSEGQYIGKSYQPRKQQAVKDYLKESAE